MRIGILGGTFDPIHRGHLFAASAVAEAAQLDRVLLVPAGVPWQKSDREITSGADRLAMLELAIGDDPRFQACTTDLDRPGPTYTIDLLDDLRSRFPDDELLLIIGADVVPKLPTWHRIDEILERVGLLVCARPEYRIDLSGLPTARITILDLPTLPISSSSIRAMVANGVDASELVPEGVWEYINDNDLYRTDAPLGARLEDFRL
jgi:nicotinate-nucleotide adenylyltransferase